MKFKKIMLLTIFSVALSQNLFSGPTSATETNPPVTAEKQFFPTRKTFLRALVLIAAGASVTLGVYVKFEKLKDFLKQRGGKDNSHSSTLESYSEHFNIIKEYDIKKTSDNFGQAQLEVIRQNNSYALHKDSNDVVFFIPSNTDLNSRTFLKNNEAKFVQHTLKKSLLNGYFSTPDSYPNNSFSSFVKWDDVKSLLENA